MSVADSKIGNKSKKTVYLFTTAFKAFHTFYVLPVYNCWIFFLMVRNFPPARVISTHPCANAISL